jgi:hypothetical protein
VAIIARGFYENFKVPHSGLSSYYDIEEGDGPATRDMTRQQSSAVMYGTSWREVVHALRPCVSERVGG